MEAVEKPFSISVELYSEELKQREEVQSLSFPTIPSTFREISDRLEELSEWSIPTCFHTVWFQGNKIQDPSKCKPSSFYLQSGDTIRISYPVKCEGKLVRNVTSWLVSTTERFDKEILPSSDSSIDIYRDFAKSPENQKYMTILSLVSPWFDKVKDMNCFYFDALGGVLLLAKLHKQIRKINNTGNLASSREFERLVSATLAMITRNDTYSKKISDVGGLDCAIESFLYLSSYKESSITPTMVTSALHALGKLVT